MDIVHITSSSRNVKGNALFILQSQLNDLEELAWSDQVSKQSSSARYVKVICSPDHSRAAARVNFAVLHS
jgi:hypothetical protein